MTARACSTSACLISFFLPCPREGEKEPPPLPPPPFSPNATFCSEGFLYLLLIGELVLQIRHLSSCPVNARGKKEAPETRKSLTGEGRTAAAAKAQPPSPPLSQARRAGLGLGARPRGKAEVEREREAQARSSASKRRELERKSMRKRSSGIEAVICRTGVFILVVSLFRITSLSLRALCLNS